MKGKRSSLKSKKILREREQCCRSHNSSDHRRILLIFRYVVRFNTNKTKNPPHTTPRPPQTNPKLKPTLPHTKPTPPPPKTPSRNKKPPPPSTPPSTSDQPRGSWADRVKVSNSTTRAKIASFLKQDTSTILKISDHVDESTSRWNRCLVGFFWVM